MFRQSGFPKRRSLRFKVAFEEAAVIRGLMSDEEWAYLQPLVSGRGGRRPRDHCLALDGIFWIVRTGVA